MSALKKWQNLKIPFVEIKHATKNFEKCIGEGGYGRVYEGELSIHGKHTKVAAKRLNEQFGQGLKEFLTEIELLSGQEHKNLISLLGYCDEDNEKIIVYEYAERGSLDRFIMGSSTTLTWMERLKICVDAARGLDHLHNHVGEHQTIIHRDIKSANILIGENWVAKISDLGLSKLSLAGLDRSAVVSYACGTLGYCEPEYYSTGIVKKESDVYSFGVVLFEVLCGKLCGIINDDGFMLSAKSAKDLFEKGKLEEIVDPSVSKQMTSVSMERFSTIAYTCLQDDRQQRPSMDLITKELEELLKLQEEYESKKEEILKSPIIVEFESNEYWKLKLPKDIEDIIKRFDSPPSYSSSKELYMLLIRGVLFDHGLRVFSITEDGIKCEKVLSKAFLKWKPRGGIVGHQTRRLSDTAMYPHMEELNVHCQISTSMLSLGVLYAARLICSFEEWSDEPGGSQCKVPNWVWIKWQCQELRVSSAHVAEINEHDKDIHSEIVWKTTLWHFFNDDNNAYFDIVINRILGGKEDYLAHVMIHGIEFEPVDMKKQHNGIEGVSISEEKVDWVKNMPSDYQDIIDRSDKQLEYTTEEELYFLLCGGIPIDNGQKWFSICKSTGSKCLMLPVIEVLNSGTNHKPVDRLSLSESRFKEVILLHDRAEFDFKCKVDEDMLSHGNYYSCYLIFKFLDGHNTPPDHTCVIKVSSKLDISRISGIPTTTYAHLKFRSLINVPIIKSTKKFKFRDSWNAPKTGVSLLPKRYMEADNNYFMKQRNDGWMEVVLFQQVFKRSQSKEPLKVNLSCVEGSFSGFVVQGIEFRPI